MLRQVQLLFEAEPGDEIEGDALDQREDQPKAEERVEKVEALAGRVEIGHHGLLAAGGVDRPDRGGEHDGEQRAHGEIDHKVEDHRQ